MAARIVPLHRAWTPEKVRQRLKISMIVNRLTNHVAGKVEMSATQVTAALGLLKKGLPDLSATEHSGDIGSYQPNTQIPIEQRYPLESTDGAPAPSDPAPRH